MRSIKVLLILALSNFQAPSQQLLKFLSKGDELLESFEFTGLCQLITQIQYGKVITKEEYQLLDRYFDDHPSPTKYCEDGTHRYRAYWWPSGSQGPRITWLRAHIGFNE